MFDIVYYYTSISQNTLEGRLVWPPWITTSFNCKITARCEYKDTLHIPGRKIKKVIQYEKKLLSNYPIGIEPLFLKSSIQGWGLYKNNTFVVGNRYICYRLDVVFSFLVLVCYCGVSWSRLYIAFDSSGLVLALVSLLRLHSSFSLTIEFIPSGLCWLYSYVLCLSFSRHVIYW